MFEEANILSEIMSNQLLLNQLLSAISEHAQPRWTDIGLFCVGIGSIIASLAVAFFAFQLNKKQISIADKQAEIAEKQSEIMEQQNKIALLEKRMEVYLIIAGIYDKHSFIDTYVLNLLSLNNKLNSNHQQTEINYNNDEVVFLSLAYLFGIDAIENKFKKYNSDKIKLYGEISTLIDLTRNAFYKAEYLFELDENRKKKLKNLENIIVWIGVECLNLFDLINARKDFDKVTVERFKVNITNLLTNINDVELIKHLKKQVVLSEIKD